MMINRRGFVAGATVAAVSMPAIVRAQATKEVVIGALYPLSGASAQIGVDAKHAFETALDIINGSHPDLDLPGAKGAGLEGLGGAKLRIVYADHQGDPQKGRAEAERVITQDKVSALVGTYQSAVAATVSQTAERYAVPFLSADNSSPSLHRRGLKYFFRAAAHDEIFSANMFDFLDAMRKRGEKVDSVALFYEDTIFGTDSSNVQRKLAGERGYKVVSDIKYRANTPSLTAEVQQLKAGNADVLLPCSYTTDSILLIKTMAELGYKPKAIVAQAAGFAEQAFYDAVGKQVENAITRASFSLDLAEKRPVVGKVNALFKARSGKDLNDNTARELMAVLILADAIDRAKSTEGAKVRDALATTNIPGERTIMPWKKVGFDETGQNKDGDAVLLQYRGGKFVTVFPEALAVAPAVWPMSKA